MKTITIPTPSIQRQRLHGILLIALGATAFSAKSILIKLAYEASAEVDAITLMTLRMLIALPFFLGAALWRGKTASSRHRAGDWVALILLGFTGYYLASLLDFLGLERISAGLERLILFLYPTFVVLFGALLHRRGVSRSQRLALLLSYAGIALVYITQTVGTSSDIGLGALLVLASALAYAIYLTAAGHYIPRFGARRFTAWSMSLACGMTIAHFLLTRPLAGLNVPANVLALGGALALFSTVLPAFLMNAGIRRIGADHAAIVGTIGPVSTLVLAWAVLGERLHAAQIFGAAMVLGGVLVVSLTKEQKA